MAQEDNFFGPEITVNGETQSAQVAETETSDNTPAAPADKAEQKPEKILGKFETQEDLTKAYTELEKQFTEKRQTEKQTERQAIPDLANTPPTLDPEVLPALDSWYAQRRELEKAQEFERRHPELKEDRLLKATVKDVISEVNSRGEMIDQEDALATARDLIAKSITPQAKEAEKQGFQEGQEVARAKEQSAAIGISGKREPVDQSKLSAKELEKYLNIPRL
jgi:hypothetical protein